LDNENLVPIKLDKPRHLLLDLNAMVNFQKMTGKDLWDTGDNFSANDLRALLWACLQHEEPTLTPGDVGKMVHIGNMRQVTETLKGLYIGAMPEKEKKKSPLAKRRSAQTGSNSGP